MEPLNFDMHLKFIEDMLSISKNAETGFVNITIEHYSPVFAKDMVENLVDFINRKVKEREVSNANLRIRYLENAMEKTQQANMHSVFFNLIEQQHHKKMLALTTDEVALAIIDKPIIAEKKSNPQRALICLVGG
jgi:capsular polysaccharide biosynthesis protein